MTLYQTQYGQSIVSWNEFKEDISPNSDEVWELMRGQTAASFVYHHYLNPKFPHGDDEDDVLASDPKQIRIWNAVKNLIPSFGDYKKIIISIEFQHHVFGPIFPKSPFTDAYRYNNVALRIAAFALLLMEMPIRYLGNFIFNRAMDIYSFKNPNFAEYYKCREAIYVGQPFLEMTNLITSINK